MTTQTQVRSTEEALKLALEALCTCGPQQKQAIAAIKEALAQPAVTESHKQEPTNLERHERNVQKFLGTQQPKEPEQEPVAWMYPDALCDRSCLYVCTKAFTQFPECANTPPQRTAAEGEDTRRAWVGLTDDEMRLIDPDGFEDNLPQMIQQALKEKNTRNGGCL